MFRAEATDAWRGSVAARRRGDCRLIRNSFADPFARTFADRFARTPERRFKLSLLGHYEAAVTLVTDNLKSSNFEQCVMLVSYPDQVRRYGHVRKASHRRISPEIDRLMMAIKESNARSAADLRVA